jgi:hypothetical protein
MPEDMEKVLRTLRNVRRVVRAEAGITGEEGLYKPRITKERKNARYERSERFGPQSSRPAPPARTPDEQRSVSPRPRKAPDAKRAFAPRKPTK